MKHMARKLELTNFLKHDKTVAASELRELFKEVKELKKEKKKLEEELEKLQQEENQKLARILSSHKTPYEKKIALFNFIKSLEVGDMPLGEKKRVNFLLQAHLYGDLAKQSMKEYKKITAETFSKAE